MAMTDSSGRTGWKDHPLAVAVAAAAATLGLVVLVFEKIVFPTQTAALQNELAELRKELTASTQRVDTKTNEADKAQRLTENLKTQLQAAQTQLVTAQLTNLFEPNNPYPAGLGSVKLGDPRDNISKAFPNATVQRASGFWSVSGIHPIFDATYYYTRLDDTFVIYQISFWSKLEKLTSEILSQKLKDVLGLPTVGPKQGCYLWTMQKTNLVQKPTKFFVQLEVGRFNYYMIAIRSAACEIEKDK